MGGCQIFRIRIPAKITPYISPTEKADIGHAFCLFMCLMPHRRLSTWWILKHIFGLSLMLIAVGVAVYAYLIVRHQEFQELVLVSGVLDTLERDRTGDFQVRLAFQGDELIYIIKDVVYPALDWENFSAKESVGSRVSLRVERAQLTQSRQKWRTIHVYGLESSRGIYLTPEDSLKELRGEVSIIVMMGVLWGLGFLVGLDHFVSALRDQLDAIRNQLSFGGPYARRKGFRPGIDDDWYY